MITKENPTIKEKELLSNLESHMKSISSTSIHKSIRLIKQLKPHLKDYFQSFSMKEKLKSKRIYFIRHGLAEHNEWNTKQSKIIKEKEGNDKKNLKKCMIIDPKLTRKGVFQVINTVNSLSDSIVFDIIYSSPLLRTIQTSLLINLKHRKNIVLVPHLREVFKGYTDMGTRRSRMINLSFCSMIDYEYMYKEEWWRKDLELKGDSLYKTDFETKEDLYIRICLFIILCLMNDKKNILLVSHSYIYYIITNKHISTGQFTSLDCSTLVCFVEEILNLIKDDK